MSYSNKKLHSKLIIKLKFHKHEKFNNNFESDQVKIAQNAIAPTRNFRGFSRLFTDVLITVSQSAPRLFIRYAKNIFTRTLIEISLFSFRLSSRALSRTLIDCRPLWKTRRRFSITSFAKNTHTQV